MDTIINVIAKINTWFTNKTCMSNPVIAINLPITGLINFIWMIHQIKYLIVLNYSIIFSIVLFTIHITIIITTFVIKKIFICIYSKKYKTKIKFTNPTNLPPLLYVISLFSFLIIPILIIDMLYNIIYYNIDCKKIVNNRFNKIQKFLQL